MTNDLLDAIRRDSNTVENYLADRMKAFPADSVLRRSMEYSLYSGGKRIRPYLCLETAALYGAPNRRGVSLWPCGLRTGHPGPRPPHL